MARSPIVLITGTFNILHADHVRLLQLGAKYGKVIVGINGDTYILRKYGSNKSVSAIDRTECLLANKYVSQVVVFEEDEPSALIRRIRPQYFVRGPDYKGIPLAEQAALDEVDCQVVFRGGPKTYSSTALLN